MSWRLWAIAFGFYIWIQATLSIRFATAMIFNPDDMVHMAIVFAVTVLLVYGAAIFFFRWFALVRAHRVEAAALICAPGLLADIPVVLNLGTFFPEMTAAQLPWFAAWVFWGYGVGLVSPFWPRTAFGLLSEE